ncbi:mitoferrin-1-like [Paramacrobiotus metropolitanus]|uniref:mitoferrin-1-like n=1 Tax=Paramacrobiotus metropolitanus TaxID=2943436 RepID=UPI00244604AF|nr:mitoferrin-1-like [Paramacrobiotus metropolitanus]
MEDDDYESLPEGLPMVTYMAAGSLAGIMEHSIMFPIDSVKTRMQSITSVTRNGGPFQTLHLIVREEGLFRPLRGMSAMVAGAGPAHALYFACYERLKRLFDSFSILHGSAAVACAGAVATLLHDSIMTPADTVKNRMQMRNSPYRNTFQCMVSMYRSEGLKAFYRSYTTQLVMNIPFQASHFVIYESSQDVLNHSRQYSPATHVVSGAIAGGAAAALTTPLDVCKTLLNTQELMKKRVDAAGGVGNVRVNGTVIKGLLGALSTIYAHRGMWGFFQGLQARVIYQMPSTAVSWSVYEFFKNYLTKTER